MSLQPKLKILAQDKESYGSVTLQDDTGAYNATTNPGGYGAPNPSTGDIVKVYLREEYMGDDKPGAWEEANKTELQGAGTVWVHDFREGVARIGYLAGVIIVGGGITALKGNTSFTLTNANVKLAGATHVEIGGKLYTLDTTKTTSSTAYVTTAFDADYISVAGNMYFEGGVYSMWNYQGYKQLVLDIAHVSCTTLGCGREELMQLMQRQRWHKAANYNFTLGNYSKAHNLALLLAPELVTSNCAAC